MKYPDSFWPIPRFWCPRDYTCEFTEAGFLDTTYLADGDRAEDPPYRLESLSDIACLVLLGEAGIGKSCAILSAIARAREKDPHIPHLLIDLKKIGTHDELRDTLLRSDEVMQWQERSGLLYVWVDSLDECQVQVPRIEHTLLSALRKLPRDGLRFRVACRSAEWPALLERDLAALWPERPQSSTGKLRQTIKTSEDRNDTKLKAWTESGVCEAPPDINRATAQDPAASEAPPFQVMRLLPLREIDIQEIALAEGLPETNRLLDHSSARDMESLAAHPITLRLLLAEYRRNPSLPASRTELYRRGILRLLEEPDPDRLGAGEGNHLTLETRYAIAGRISAVLLLGGFDTIWKNRDDHGRPETAVAMADLVGHAEEGLIEPIRQRHLIEVLRTALFRHANPLLAELVHRSYTEHLAADYLAAGRVFPGVLNRWIAVEDETGVHVPSAIRGLGAQLATRDPALFSYLSRVDPGLLIGSDLETCSDDQRSALVDALLTYATKHTSSALARYYTIALGRLKHDGLQTQLCTVIANSNAPFTAREDAIRIATGCQVKALAPDLRAIALDPEAPLVLRTRALRSLEAFGPSDDNAALRALLTISPKDDPEDELRGMLLRVLWPDHLSPRELFENLSLPQRPNFIGAYSVFTDKALQQLPPKALPIALMWASQQLRAYRHNLPYSIRDLIETITTLAWNHLEDAEVTHAFAELVRCIMEHYLRLPLADPSKTMASPEPLQAARRRRLLEILLMEGGGAPTRNPRFAWLHPPLVRAEDLEWLLERCINESDSERTQAWRWIIRSIADGQNLDHIDLIRTFRDRDSRIREWFGHYVDVELGSPIAQSLREDYLAIEFQRRELEEQERDVAQAPPLLPRLENLLTISERVESSLFWRIDQEMTAEEGAREYKIGPHYFDMRTQPGWLQGDYAIRARILDEAERFLRDFPVQDDDWLRKSIPQTLYSGVRAFALLQAERPERFQEFSNAVWCRWVPALLRCDFLNHLGIPHARLPVYDGPEVPLIKEAHRRTPEDMRIALLRILDTPSLTAHMDWHLAKVHLMWDTSLAMALLERLQQGSLTGDSWRRVLGELLRRDVAGAETYAWSQVTLDQRTESMEDTEREKRSQDAAVLLLTWRFGTAWPKLWALISNLGKFGMKLLENYVDHVFAWPEGRQPLAPHSDKAPPQDPTELPARVQEELLTWLLSHYPTRDRRYDGVARFVDTKDRMEKLRDDLLRRLSERADDEAVEVLGRLRERHPEVADFLWLYPQAVRRAREGRWRAVPAKKLLELVKGIGFDRFSQLIAGACHQPRRRVFASYARKDLETVNSLVSRLKKEGYFDVFMDLDMSGDQNWWRRICQEIEAADVVVFFWSKAARESEWVKEELQHVTKIRGEREGHPRLITVLLEDDEPESGHPLAEPNFVRAGDMLG